MKIHTCFITYNRLDLTKQAIASYLETVSVPFSFVVVDNNSSDGTREWLTESGYPAILLDANLYPGYACNRGWEQAPDDADFLHRADNDFIFLPDWCIQVMRVFKHKEVGQVGLRTKDEELRVRSNVGGNNVIRRELWDAGLRYDERPWPKYDPGHTEDSYFSPAVAAMGWKWTRVNQPCIRSLSDEDPATSPDPEYYFGTWESRNILDNSLAKYGLTREQIVRDNA